MVCCNVKFSLCRKDSFCSGFGTWCKLLIQDDAKITDLCIAFSHNRSLLCNKLLFFINILWSHIRPSVHFKSIYIGHFKKSMQGGQNTKGSNSLGNWIYPLIYIWTYIKTFRHIHFILNSMLNRIKTHPIPILVFIVYLF